jgi:SAM-dependent methyltransferase
VDSLAGHGESRKTFEMKTGFTDVELKGKLVLDVGCGTGRFMEIASDMGAEVIGVDLSYAVDAAYRNMGRRQGIHIVQADLFRMPFRPVTFDVIYSIGVLHHTPSTRDAFLALLPLLKPMGIIAIWVYMWGGDYSVYLDRVRSLTVHLPKPLLYGLCWISVPLLHALAQFPQLLEITKRIPTSDQHRGLRWDVLDTFDSYSPKYQWKHTEAEVREWFERADLEDVAVLSFPVSVKGRRPAV